MAAVLLDFLGAVRKRPPTKRRLAAFFAGRHLGYDLAAAVARTWSTATGDRPVTWPTCTNPGAMKVTYEYLRQLGYGSKEDIAACDDAFPADPD